MFKKTKQTQLTAIDQQEISTLIGEGFVLNGDITGQSVIRIDGKVVGQVKVGGGIILGEKGSIMGDIETTSAIIYGSVKGNVKAKQLEIKKTGEVNGDIKTETLEIEFGAQYNGKLEMKQLIKSEEKELQD
ncbi:polymer-forming cytoskeletal protein [Pedobacter sp. KR3-3]|uniref:Polymer-forming cytoskeletal protein n=1 Tax=Pedobacter albus TaxID=3113905 RepID=A0ABU7IA44_9SPHI|nr:polymer-forming cytoskeletal protein [Pedobacter sp. KR3-3]MEE1946336.1 polymer-forming cytoskeletal protein [Pedobacter sp. KR3-3]